MTSTELFHPEQKFGAIPMENAMQLSGLEIAQQMMIGELPAPTISRTMNFKMIEVGDGTAVFQGVPLAGHCNPMGSIHGGWTGAIMDSALGLAVYSKLQPGQGFTTIEFKVNMVRPMFPDTGDVFCAGKVLHFGRTIATCEATLKNADGKLLAHGTATCSILQLKKPD